jgi:hypothetical protein
MWLRCDDSMPISCLAIEAGISLIDYRRRLVSGKAVQENWRRISHGISRRGPELASEGNQVDWNLRTGPPQDLDLGVEGC